MCIVGAGIVSSTVSGVITGRFVETSLVMWPSSRKAKRTRGVADSGDDYHGNFNSQLFEKWFRELCVTLATLYGSCNIHMDGAKYHKRNTNICPKSTDKKFAIQQWLSLKGVSYSPGMVKAELLCLVKENKEKAV
ncbi:hypothetical protein AeMF1_011351 [Aphanomyces euteiches]|nr:hypothetical protein AeMF1_011351 [Aphanomyces euteiches]